MAYTLTTGVIAKHKENKMAFVEIINYGTSRKFFKFRVIDWTNRRPGRIISPPGTSSLRPNRNETAGFFLREGVVRYEIEITVFDKLAKKNEIVFNCFGGLFGTTPIAKLLEGNTVFHKDLILKKKHC